MPPPLRGRRYLPLTPREFQVLRLRALGRTWAEIMRELRVGNATVGSHIQNANERLGLERGSPLVETLTRIGWLVVPDELPDMFGKSGPRKP